MVLATLAVQLHPERCAVQIAQCRPRARLRFVASARGEKPFDIIWADLGRLDADAVVVLRALQERFPFA